MEKNTKILLGLGAIVAAYLILKPKMAAGQSDPRNAQPEEKEPIFDEDFNVNTKDEYLCPDGYVLFTSMFDSSGNQIELGMGGQRQFCKAPDGTGQELGAVKNPNYGRLIIKKPLTPKDCSEAKSNLELFGLAYNSINPQPRRGGGAYRGPYADIPWFLIPDDNVTAPLDVWIDYKGKNITLTPEQIEAQELQKQQRMLEKERLKAEYYAQQDRKAKAKLYAEDTIKAIGLTDCYNEWIAEQLKLEQERNRMEAMYPRAAFQ
jgi:hypothetical protein